ncbi:MAG: protein BatD [Gammaproteobacteria bacterium]|nr:protein BatD [Gammaproteobacteria bacterium]MYC52469.1 protein BatD [Gammaproteobacteria bacterium]
MRGVRLATWLVALLPPALAAGPTDAAAQQVSARAYLSSNQVGVGQQFVLNVEVSGAQGVDQDPELPDLSSFSVYLGSGSSSSMQMSGGRTTISVTIQYRFQATRAGTFTIDPIDVRAAGSTFATEPLTLTVSDAPVPQGPSAGPGAADRGVAPEDLFVEAVPSHRQVYENQPVVVDYRIFTRVNVSSYSITQLPPATGFWVEEYPPAGNPVIGQTVRDGMQYTTATIRKVALFPTGSGARTLEPLGIEAQVRVRRRSAFDPFEDFFGRGSLLNSNISTAAASRPVEIEVLPLPGGRPENFTGFVGDLEVAATLDRDSVQVSDAVTLTVEVAGSGNLRMLAEPEVEVPPGFEAFPPEVTERVNRTDAGVSGTRTYEYVLVPRVPGVGAIPPVELAYFDPEREVYEVAASEALAVEVTGVAADGPLGAGRVRAGVEELRTDIRFIQLGSPALVLANRTLLVHPLFWVTLLVPLAVVGGAAGLRRHRDRLHGDVAYARSRRAAKVARKRLMEARKLADGKDVRAFYAEAGHALEGFLADKLNIAAAGMIRDEVRHRLSVPGVDTEAAEPYMECLEECDRQRFAPPTASAEERARFLGQVEAAMAAMAEHLAR